MSRRPALGCRILACLVLGLLCASLASAQPAKADPSPQIESLRQRINALQARDDLDAAVRDHAVQTYQQAISALESASSDREQTAKLRETAADAPADINRLKAEIRALEAPPDDAALSEMSIGVLAGRADTLDGRLADTQATLADLRDQLTRLAQRPEAARQELADARGALQSLETTVAANDERPSVATEAQRSLLAARREALTAEIERLQQELASVDARERLVEAQRMLAESRLSRDTQALAAVQRALGQRQNETAQSLRENSQDKLTELRGAAAPLADAAQRNVELARKLSDVTADSKRLTSRQVARRNDVEELQRRLNLVQRQLEIGGTSVALGDVLRSQQRDLAEPKFDDSGAKTDAPDIASAELQRFQLQQARAELDDIAARVQAAADQAELSAAQRESLTGLLQQRRQILDLLVDAEGRFIDIGRDLSGLGEQYEETLSSFERLLDERLFWLPSFRPLQLGWFAGVARDLPWVFNPLGWANASRALASGISNRPWLSALGLIIVGAMFGVRRPLRRRLKMLSEPVGNVRRDTFWVTLRATFVTLLLSIPVTLALVAVGLLIRQADDPAPFTLAVSASAIQLGLLVVFIEPFAQVCRANGLAEAHFLWDETARRGLHRSLRWLLAVLVLPTLVLTLTEAVDDDAKRQTLGRAAFVFSSLMIMAFSWRLLHPSRGVMSNLVGSDNRAHWRLGYLWLPLAVGVPLLLSGMAIWGYYYTALQLQTRFFYSAAVLSACLILYSLIVRWLTVAERRLALTRALRKREEAREARATREAAAAAGESTPENLDTLEIDLLQISEQTRGLIKVVITLIIGAALWFVWSDTLPALQLLDNVTLWQYSSEVEGEMQLTNVTLGALLLALAVGLVTALAGRNLPGFLEITVLRRFSLDSGSRYAMATLFQYAIVIIGLLIAVGIVGLRWSSIQWLVAALGVGLGFGLQEIFANFVSGIVILFERPVRVGDTVTVGTLTGTVSRIRIRATTITDWDNKEVVIPNKTFITETVINWTLTDDITRLIIRVHLALDTDTEVAEKLLNDAIAAEPVALDEPAPSVFLVGYDDGTLIYEARVFYHDLYNLLPLQHALYKRIHAAFTDNRVTVSFPQRDLHLRSMDPSFERFGRAADETSGSKTDDTGDAPAPQGGGS